MAARCFGSGKRARTAQRPYTTRQEARADGVAYIEMFSNSRRKHCYLGYGSPNESAVRTAAEAIRPMIGATTAVLTLKNGLEAPTEVVEVSGPEHVMVGVTPVRSVLAAPGRLRHLGGVDPNLTLLAAGCGTGSG